MRCKYCGCYIPDGSDVCPSCNKKQDETNDIDDMERAMTNLTIKTNLLVILEDYLKIAKADYRDNARKTVVLALKAIDAYGKPLDEDENGA